jgi:hypothetical protein
MKHFNVNIYHSGFCSYSIEAKDEFEAVELARKLPINNDELLQNMEVWEEADVALELNTQNQ